MKPKCWDAICYAAGAARGAARPVTLTQSDCIELTTYVIQLTARGMAELADRPEQAPCPVPGCGPALGYCDDHRCPAESLHPSIQPGYACPECAYRCFGDTTKPEEPESDWPANGKRPW